MDLHARQAFNLVVADIRNRPGVVMGGRPTTVPAFAAVTVRRVTELTVLAECCPVAPDRPAVNV